MIEQIEKILKADISEVIKTPELSLSLLSCYSVLYLNGGIPRACERSQRKYYAKLKIDGMAKAKEKKQVRTCAPSWKGRKYVSGLCSHLDSETVSDEVCLRALAYGHLKESDFKKLPEGLEEAKEEAAKSLKEKAAKQAEAATDKTDVEGKYKKSLKEIKGLEAGLEEAKAKLAEAVEAKVEAEAKLKAQLEPDPEAEEAKKAEGFKLYAEDVLATLESLDKVSADLLKKLVVDLGLAEVANKAEAIKALEDFRKETIL